MTEKSILSEEISILSPSNSTTKQPWRSDDIINMLREEREKIIQRGKDCKALLHNVSEVSDKLRELKNSHQHVSSKTNQLHSECANLIEEKNDLKQSYDKINSMLTKQVEIRNASRQMPDIKKQIVTVLNTVFQGYQEGTLFDDCYGKFFIECRRIKESISKLESCLLSETTNNDDLLLHFEEIYTVYFDIREQLIKPIFIKNLCTLVTKLDRNYCELLRQTSTSLVRLLRNEIQLFYQIFPSVGNDTIIKDTSNNELNHQVSMSTTNNNTSDNNNKSIQYNLLDGIPIKRQALDHFLDLLCRVFYEHLRPVIIHVNHLETLTELYKLVTEIMRPEVNEECYQIMMGQLAEDIQERMIFRSEVFIQESILDYKPSSGDLAYPEKLEIVSGCEFKDFQSMWYPTVQRTVLALFYLNRVFDSLTFKELAQEVIIACYKSLDIGQKLIEERHNGAKIEAALFLNKHLAIIKDQLESYGIDGVEYSTNNTAQSKIV